MSIDYEARLKVVRTAARLAPQHQARIFKSRLNPRRHRWVTGGSWDEMGRLQLEFLVAQGLRPAHTLLDVGCGGLRGGVHFVRYLDPGHYVGMDKNAAFLKAGEGELRLAGIADRGATLVQDEAFAFGRLGRRFDFAFAQSLFTHLPVNAIMRCLGEMQAALVPGGRFYATFFRNPGPRLATGPVRTKNHVVHLDRDPFGYDPGLFAWAVEGSALTVDVIGDWGHPRGQEMLLFTRRTDR
jgi:SAM-dependent methyltransferase